MRFIPSLDQAFGAPVCELAALKREALGVAQERVVVACERDGGNVCRYEFVFPAALTGSARVARLAERVVKFLLWSAGGWRVFLAAPEGVGAGIKAAYAKGGARTFDCDFFAKAYQREPEFVLCGADEVPAAREAGMPLGGYFDGCRIGFDLGASDFKLAAMHDGEVIWSDELPWNPRVEADPEYHYIKLRDGLKLAASKLPRVDAIGGSSAGVVVDNQIRVASLFRSIPEARYAEAAGLFLRLQKEWGVPLEVANDGDVSALAGALSLGVKGVIGLAMGSSEAVGFLDQHGHLTGRLNELAFAPVDLNVAAAADEWSGDAGVGALYFSQQAVNKLALAGGETFPQEMGLPERLKVIQAKMPQGDALAREVYDAIGIYLGYAVPWYAEFYDYSHLMLLGRVMSGEGGDMILAKANEVLQTEFPQVAEAVRLFTPDERARRVGQAAAAASLPSLRQ